MKVIFLTIQISQQNLRSWGKIAYYRKIKGYTQEKLAELMEAATSYIGAIGTPNMSKSISLTTLFRIANILEIPAHKFLEQANNYIAHESLCGFFIARTLMKIYLCFVGFLLVFTWSLLLVKSA